MKIGENGWPEYVGAGVILFIAVFLCSVALCVPDPPVVVTNEQIVVIDSCEYLIWRTTSSSPQHSTHKGNCKFCAERNRK